MSEAKKVAILISGGGSNMVSLVKAMQAAEFPAHPCVVIANSPDAGGLEKAQGFGIPTDVIISRAFPDRASFEAELQNSLIAHDAQLVCLAGFMRILTPEFVSKWEGRMLNIHPSILPLFPGLNTHQRALDAGMAVHGASVHEVTAELDAGRILGQAVVPVEAGDTADSLAARVLKQEHKLYPEALRRFLSAQDFPVSILAT